MCILRMFVYVSNPIISMITIITMLKTTTAILAMKTVRNVNFVKNCKFNETIFNQLIHRFFIIIIIIKIIITMHVIFITCSTLNVQILSRGLKYSQKPILQKSYSLTSYETDQTFYSFLSFPIN